MTEKLAAAIVTTYDMSNAPFPTDNKKLRSFRGACIVYRRFIEGFAKSNRPLNSMLMKGAEKHLDYPTTDQLEYFQEIRDALVNQPVLDLKKRGREFMLDRE